PTCDAESLLRVDRVFADFVDDAKDAVGKVRPGAYVVFNCVNNWPVENIAPSDADIVYIEVWPPHDTYADIVELISEGRRLGSGKAVVLAAYLSPAFEPSVRYLDAVIFSAGGSHIELGEGENMLADPYFPKYERIPSRLAHALRRYYDFCTRYVELLYLGVTEGAPGVEVSVLDYPSTTQDSAEEEIWLFPKRKENLVIINLVNFLRVKVPLWRSDQQAPPILSDVRLRVRLERPLSEVYFASPEYEDGKMVKLEAIRVGEPREYAYEFVAPHLEYWSTVVIREQAG
ncbi:MAG: glycoside hydrolase family 66 protein, partial [Bacillota bacterium]